jgi:hypothetical protein
LAERAPLNAAAVALDATRVALAGISGLDAMSTLSYRVFDVETGSELSRQDYAHSASPESRPEFLDIVVGGTSVALARLAPDRVLLAWVTPDRHAVSGLLLDDAGTPLLTNPVTLTRGSTQLDLPQFAQLAPGRLGMVWTGDTGLEVRYRTVSEENLATPSGGIIVNTQQRCSQTNARIVSTDTGDGALIVWSAETPQPLLGRFVDSAAEPHFTPATSDAPILDTCSRGVSGAATIGTSAAGTLILWSEQWTSEAGASSGNTFMQIVRASDFL